MAVDVGVDEDRARDAAMLRCCDAAYRPGAVGKRVLLAFEILISAGAALDSKRSTKLDENKFTVEVMDAARGERRGGRGGGVNMSEGR